MVYNIGHLEFKSKKAAEDYTRNTINSVGINTNIDNAHIHFQFFVDLLNNHHKFKNLKWQLEKFALFVEIVINVR